MYLLQSSFSKITRRANLLLSNGIKSWCVFTILLLGLCTLGVSQSIDFGVACPNADDVLSPIEVGTPMTPITIDAVSAPGAFTIEIRSVSQDIGGFEFSLCGTPCVSPFVTNGVTIAVSVSGEEVEISGTPDVSLEGTSLRITLRATSGVTECDRTFELPFEAMSRPPVDLVLVLDRSGSMGWGYNGSFSPPAGQRRWDGLVTGLGALSTQLSGLDLLPADNVGMRYFSSSVITPAAPFNVNLIGLDANAAQIPIVAGPVIPGGSTALGDGILAGRDILLAGDASHTKAMIVLSDGVQNSGDQINTANPVETNSTADINGPGDEISIYTVCIGSSGHNPILMSSISSANKGIHMNTAAGLEADFTTFFSTHLVNILSGSSPQHIAILKDNFPASGDSYPQTSQTFQVNNGVSKVLVTLIAPNQLEPSFISFRRNGTDLIEEAEVFRSSGALTIAVNRGEAVPELGGEWIVEASLFGSAYQTEVPYTMIQMVDDHYMNPTYDLGGTDLKVGQSIAPSVGLNYGITSIENANIEALILKPGDDINDLIARAKVDFSQSDDDPGSPDVAKLAVLLQDTDFRAQIAANNQLVSFSYNAQTERYEGNYNNLDIAGTYTIYYLIKANDAQLGDIVRQHQESFNVRFPDIDMDNSDVVLTTTANGITLLTFRPIASNGKLIGSGWGGVISLDANNASIQNIRDLGDGSYELEISGELSGSGSISIAGENMFEGNLAALTCGDPNAGFLQKIKCWLLQLGLPTWIIWLILGLIVVALYFVFRRRP